jgi:hypothetical protein
MAAECCHVMCGPVVQRLGHLLFKPRVVGPNPTPVSDGNDGEKLDAP